MLAIGSHSASPAMPRVGRIAKKQQYDGGMPDSMRLDKWLWVARFFRARGLAADAASLGRISVNGQVAKPSREVRPGDCVGIQTVAWNVRLTRRFTVRGIAAQRGPAQVAQNLYVEAPESVAAWQAAYEQCALHAEPAQAIARGRPSRRDRAALDQAAKLAPDWDERWSAQWPEAPD